MKTRLIVLSGMVLLTLAITGTLTFNSTSNAQKSPSAPQVPPPANVLQVVDWNTELRQKTDAVRIKRNSKYDINEQGANPADFVFGEQSQADLTIFPSPHTPAEPAFPVAQADVIVVGKVNSAAAHLSNDRTHVYSEYDISVIKVFKGDQVQENSTLTAERAGGKVKLPSGKTLSRYGVYGKNFPNVNSIYIFFLQQNKEGDDFNIITGYEVRGSLVYPLDRSPDQTNPLSYLENFDKYYAMKKLAFWTDLNRELRLNAAKPRRVEAGATK